MGKNDSIMYHHRDPTATVPLFLDKNSLRTRANPIVHHVSPVMEDGMLVRLSGQSPLRLLDRRLDELALPKHGTKLDKWTRVEKRENELMRERKSQAATESEREAGPERRRREAAIPISDPREPTITEKEVQARSLILVHAWRPHRGPRRFCPHSMHILLKKAAPTWQWRRVALHEGHEGLDRGAVFAPLFAALHSPR